MVALPLPDIKYERLNLLIHECFHRIQPLIDLDSIGNYSNAHLDTKEGRIYLKLELEALKTALSCDNPKNHIKNALLFRQYRQQLIPGAKKEENSLELNEGLAEYTGSILSGRDIETLTKHYISKIDWFYQLPTFTRSFAYFTIPVYGFFMKQSNEKWNLSINNKTNLTEFISDFYNMEILSLNYTDIEQLGKYYGIDSIVNMETEREQKHLNKIEKYKALFLTDSVVSIELENMKIGFNPSNLVPLGSFGIVYPNLRITDNWGILEVDSCGALVSLSWDNVIISYPKFMNDNFIEGYGWNLKFNEGWKLKKSGSVAGFQSTVLDISNRLTYTIQAYILISLFLISAIPQPL